MKKSEYSKDVLELIASFTPEQAEEIETYYYRKRHREAMREYKATITEKLHRLAELEAGQQ